MASSVFQINVKPNTPGEVGLPKIPIDSGQILSSGIEGDYNRFRFNKKNNDPEMAIMLISKDILEGESIILKNKFSKDTVFKLFW